jgi:4-amino-4-deoxy-L-arabinose transferase-like glycosyltransferase
VKHGQAAWFLTIALLLGVVFRAQDLLAPYENGHRGACASLFAMMAKNHQRYGIAATGGVGVLNPVRAPQDHFQYYLHHPPGSIWLATVGAALGGSAAAPMRLVFLPLSIGIALLVYRLARTRDRRLAAFAGAVALLAPIATYYGAFVNFELPTIFFTLLALHLFLRYERRGRACDRNRFLLAQAAAVGCDWIALGLPLTLIALAPLRRREDDSRPRCEVKPLRTAAYGLLASVLVVVLVKALYAFQVARYGGAQGGTEDFGYYLQATPLANDFAWSTYFTAMGGHLVLLFSWPLLVLAALGLLPLSVRAAQRRLTALDTAAAVSLVLALANVTILANHAWKHDYYLLYAVPAAALLAVLALEMVARVLGGGARREGITFAVGAIVAALLAFRSAGLLESRRGFTLAELGDGIAAHTAQDAVVVLPDYYTLQVTVQADRFVYSGGVRSKAALDAARKVAAQFGQAGRPLVYVVGRGGVATLPEEMQELLSEAPRRESGPFEIYDLGRVAP